MENEQLIEILKAQNELILLLSTECRLKDFKNQEKREKITSLLSILIKFNKEFK